MKQCFALLLALSLVLGLAACGGNTPADATTAPTVSATSAPEIPATEATVPPETQAAIPVTEAVTLVDTDQLTFTVTEYRTNEHLGLEMHVYCENKTDATMMFSLDSVSVCGVMFDPFWAEEVAPGKKVNSVVYFDTFALEEMGVKSPDEISFRLYVFDNERWMDEPFLDDRFSVYPTGLTPEQVVYPQHQPSSGQTVIMDNDSLVFIVERVDDTQSGFYTLDCYIANRTDRDLLVSWDGVSVNGFMVDPFWAAAVGAGKQLYTQVSFPESELLNQGIEIVDEIEFTLTAMDYDSLDGTFLVEETCTFQPK